MKGLRTVQRLRQPFKTRLSRAGSKDCSISWSQRDPSSFPFAGLGVIQPFPTSHVQYRRAGLASSRSAAADSSRCYGVPGRNWLWKSGRPSARNAARGWQRAQISPYRWDPRSYPVGQHRTDRPTLSYQEARGTVWETLRPKSAVIGARRSCDRPVHCVVLWHTPQGSSIPHCLLELTVQSLARCSLEWT